MKLADRLYSETDDSCALCGARGSDNLTIHHIDCDRTNDVYDNMIVLCYNCHTRHHQNRGVSRNQIENRKLHLIARVLTDYGLNAMKIAARNNFGVVAMPFLLYHLVDLGYMSKQENQMGYGALADATARFSITDTGRKLLHRWDL